MQREIFHYIEYINRFKELKKPQMPNFDLGAYTDIEYYKAINEINEEFDRFNDLKVYEEFLKGE